MNFKLKSIFLEKKRELGLNSIINYDFLFSNQIYFFDIVEKWNILEELNINLKKINQEQFQYFFSKKSPKEIQNNIILLSQANLEKKFLHNIGLLVKGKHYLKKLIKSNNQN